VLFYPSTRWFFTNGMGDNGFFFVANADAGGYWRSVGGRAHFFGLGMALGEPRGGVGMGAAPTPYKQGRAGIFHGRRA
jgi:hypothetical protein